MKSACVLLAAFSVIAAAPSHVDSLRGATSTRSQLDFNGYTKRHVQRGRVTLTTSDGLTFELEDDIKSSLYTTWIRELLRLAADSGRLDELLATALLSDGKVCSLTIDLIDCGLLKRNSSKQNILQNKEVQITIGSKVAKGGSEVLNTVKNGQELVVQNVINPCDTGGVTDQYGLPCNTNINPCDTGGVIDQYGQLCNSFVPPSDPFVPPSDPFGPPSEPFGPPSEPFVPPSDPFGPPSEPFGPPSEPFGPPFVGQDVVVEEAPVPDLDDQRFTLEQVTDAITKALSRLVKAKQTTAPTTRPKAPTTY